MKITKHAAQQAKQRGVPEWVIDAIQNGEGHNVTIGGVDYHTLRYGEREYALGVQRGRHLVTIIQHYDARGVLQYLNSKGGLNRSLEKKIEKLPVVTPSAFVNIGDHQYKTTAKGGGRLR